jgi:hypothetical protein
MIMARELQDEVVHFQSQSAAAGLDLQLDPLATQVLPISGWPAQTVSNVQLGWVQCGMLFPAEAPSKNNADKIWAHRLAS